MDRLAWTLIHSLWQGVGGGIVLAISLGFAYKASARVQYWLGYAALALLLGFPLATYVALGATPESAAGTASPLTASASAFSEKIVIDGANRFD